MSYQAYQETYSPGPAAAFPQPQHQHQHQQQRQQQQQDHGRGTMANNGPSFYNPFPPSPHSSRPPTSLLSPAASSLRPGSAASAYFTPSADPAPANTNGYIADAPAGGFNSGRLASPIPPIITSPAPPSEPPSVLASNSILSPRPNSSTTAPASSDRDREKDGGRSITKSYETKGSRLTGSDALIRAPSKRAGGLLLTVSIEAVVVIVLAGIVFGRITADISNQVQDIKTVSVYLAIFVFGMIFQVAITLDAVRLKNSIQVIGVSIFNVALAIAAGLEIMQVRDAIQAQDSFRPSIPCPFDENRLCRAERVLYPQVHRLLIGVTVVCAVFEIPILFWTAKLWTEFGWIIYQKIGADLRIRSMFMWYQTFIVLLKFTFFFGVGFTIFYLILVADTTDWEYGVTIAAVPMAVATLFAAAFAVRREIMSLMALSLFLMLAGLVYFVYKLTQVWVPATAAQYQYVRLTITFISAFAILSLGLTLANGIVCLLNFREGLKQAHDSIGRFGGVRRRRARDSSKGEVLDLDRHIDPPTARPAVAPAAASRPGAYAEDSLYLRPQHDGVAYNDAAAAPNSLGMVPQQNATRVSLD
ncbi:uncharacterized protein PFL1_00165 [Pseudozyma flocculosa PF-1]|uniref:TRP C-terminal domain-containing protein n=1 Tax=Pseudozyma flocculosa TaxID=84751 RepID=A0A5C3ETX0_9BASI|nr:uncharacterized protein PFL1_00165 [Pseudozyma flocculosa PF-1]EPQ31966.1 hypothetical protein PFL1_00165 [Pseudozyma flocculosa PF-1]SPO35115.1 uncharacterized protein PSFLO_00586 [Pseudozyma flocculosa]